jgi:hypothetical protein
MTQGQKPRVGQEAQESKMSKILDHITCTDELSDGDVYRICESSGAFWVGTQSDLSALDGSECGLSRAIRIAHGEGEDSYSEILEYAKS